tara:strand:- start:842 stop:3034 length:2193 start_codon:yes stop_codon:yes gene_type:complete
MKKIIYRSLISLIIFLLILIVYLSIIGVKTDKFNSKIISQIKKINPTLEININDVSATLDLLSFSINAKTIATDLIYRDKIIKIETIKSKISIRSFLNNKFALTEISISTKSLAIKDLISLVRLINNDPKIFIAEKFIKKGFLVADLKIEFDQFGKIKSNYEFNGLVRDGKISLFKRYNLDKIDFIFKINEKNLEFSDVKFLINNKNISIPKVKGFKQNNEYLISGNLNSENTSLTKNEINKFINTELLKLDIKEILFNSKNDFRFKITQKFKVKDLDIKSDVDIENLKVKNFLKLKRVFPKIKKDLIFQNQKLRLEYKKNDLNIVGAGEIFLQNEIDKINYEINKKKDEVIFQTKLDISKNEFKLDLLNYKKIKNSDLELNFKGQSKIKEKIRFNEISLREKNNIILIKNLILANDNKIDDLGEINLNYIDKEDLKNNLRLIKKDNDYLISGKNFNINNVIDRLLNSDNEKKLKFFSKNFKIFFDVEKIHLDKINFINNLNGFLSLNKNDISELNLESKFSNQKNIKFTIKDNGKEKITTLYSYKAKPFVDRYKFIKGFEEGDLDFYSIKKNGITNSILRIDNFKIQEIPVLAKLLTLASLQGIADLLTGEGIRFTDFEMKFSSKDKLMTIEELYAIGPAISILMEGYIQSKKLISLRGTLVPATTVNRTISSIPLIGDILVGKKVGEGVFGVSFKIKGPPGDLETTVNPIKTLTPRFITRTLEKIKKN